jgi:hypothetical protein
MKKFWPVFMLALIAALVVARPAFAANCTDDRLVMGDNYSLATGQQLDSNLIVMGGNATVSAGATVNCTVVVMGGNVDVAGTVTENVVVLGGNAHLHSTAIVDGQLETFGGAITRDDGAQVRGGQSQGFGFNGNGQGFPFRTDVPVFGPVFDLYQSILRIFFGSLSLGLLALLVVLFWPEQTSRVTATITNAPGASGGLGLLTVVAVPVLMLLAAITICGLPLTFAAMILFTAALVFGWLALGQLVGLRLAGSLRLYNVTPAVAAALGTGLLSLVMSAISWVPCIGWVAPVVLASVGLGAVTLTRFGTQPYLGAAPASPPTPPAPSNPGQPVLAA